MNNVTGIIVSYNTPELLKKCYESIRRFYPCMKLIIIDGSDYTNACYSYARSRNPMFNKVVSVGYNIGHGNGMKLAATMVLTEYFVLIDSDVTIDKAGVVETMLSQMSECVYGVGQIMQVDYKGLNVEKGIPYLHPHFAMVSKTAYLKFAPFINHGAPLLSTMKHLQDSDYTLHPFDVSEYITHKCRGTRDINPKHFHPKFWDRV
jgi:GT2 family glycosyltransferase